MPKPKSALSRRGFLGAMGGVAAGVGAVAVVSRIASRPPPQLAVPDPPPPPPRYDNLYGLCTVGPWDPDALRLLSKK